MATIRPSGFRQVFEKIAGENEIELVRFHLPGFGAVLLYKGDVRIQARFGIRIEIHGQFSLGADVVNELPVATTQVENGAGFGRELLEKRGTRICRTRPR